MRGLKVKIRLAKRMREIANPVKILRYEMPFSLCHVPTRQLAEHSSIVLDYFEPMRAFQLAQYFIKRLTPLLLCLACKETK